MARRYRFVLNRGGYVDTVVLSPDGNSLDGRNNEGYVLHGTRTSRPGGR